MPDVLTLTTIFALIVIANIATRLDSKWQNLFYWLLRAFTLPLFFIGITYVLTPSGTLAVAQEDADLLQIANPLLYGLTFQFMAIWGILTTVRSLRVSLAAHLPLNPDAPVHTLALFMAGLLLGNVMILLTQDGIEQIAETAVSDNLLDLIWPQLLFVVIAILGVGWKIRRPGAALVARLGLEKPTRAQLIMGIRWIVILVVLQWIMGAVWTAVDPIRAEELGGVNELLYTNVDTVWEWFILALAAGVGEELLFRGAIQPVFGLPVTAVLFALSHVQYGFTPITLLILIIGIALGRIRNQANTTTAIFVHTGYNFVLGIIALLVG
ncbi:MAG: CPBP family intramembrane metalloprotease [Chloroflexi bacterium]|nr:CPBP family intramembrane metalloprotease [Chloroflexota bacterium]